MVLICMNAWNVRENRSENPGTRATLGTERTQAKQKTQHRNLKRWVKRTPHCYKYWCIFVDRYISSVIINFYSNMTSFFRFVNKRAIYRLGIISLAHVQVHVTDFPVVNVPVDELSSARIWQYKLCATLSANVNINYCLPIKV